MSNLKKIKLPVRAELEQFESYFRNVTKSDVKLLNLILNYIIRTKGKQIRPLFVFLSAKIFGKIDDSTYLAATTIELLHSATLVHDDVIDESFERRGKLSINAIWRNKVAVLIGDFLLSKGLLLTTKHKEFEILEIISKAVQDTIEGELLQDEKSRKLDINEETYFEIIKKKTASLIATSIAVGTFSATRDIAQVEVMHEMGMLAGIAFQIRDDIFDYQDKGIIGKPTGNDIKDKKITLPLIHVLNKASTEERREILRIVKRKNHRKEQVLKLINLVKERGGLEYANLKMYEYRDKALAKLNELPESEAREAMADLINYIITRKK